MTKILKVMQNWVARFYDYNKREVLVQILPDMEEKEANEAARELVSTVKSCNIWTVLKKEEVDG